MNVFRTIVGLFPLLRGICFWFNMSFCLLTILCVCQFVSLQDNAKRFPWTVIIFGGGREGVWLLKIGDSSHRLLRPFWQSIFRYKGYFIGNSLPHSFTLTYHLYCLQEQATVHSFFFNHSLPYFSFLWSVFNSYSLLLFTLLQKLLVKCIPTAALTSLRASFRQKKSTIVFHSVRADSFHHSEIDLLCSPVSPVPYTRNPHQPAPWRHDPIRISNLMLRSEPFQPFALFLVTSSSHPCTLSLCTMLPLTSLFCCSSPGPEFWGLINPNWNMCERGRRQSPINIEPDKLVYDPHLRHIHIDKHRVSENWVVVETLTSRRCVGIGVLLSYRQA